MSAIIKSFPRALSASPQLVPVETALQTFRVIRGDPSTLFAHAPRSVPGAVQLRDERLPRMIRVRQAEAELYHALSTRWMDQQTGAAIIGNLFRIFGVKPGDDNSEIATGRRAHCTAVRRTRQTDRQLATGESHTRYVIDRGPANFADRDLPAQACRDRQGLP